MAQRPRAPFGSGHITDAYLIRYGADASEVRRVPLDVLYTSPEWAFHGMIAEPNPDKWPAFGKLEFKLDGRAAEAPILRISDDELGLQVDNQVFRGLSKSELLTFFRD